MKGLYKSKEALWLVCLMVEKVYDRFVTRLGRFMAGLYKGRDDLCQVCMYKGREGVWKV